MERDEFVAILSPLLLALRCEFDKPTWSAYYAALKDIQAPLFERTVATLMREALSFVPKAGELRAHAERHRRAIVAAHPHDGCVECEDTKGWRAVEADGVRRLQRCPCVARYQAQLARIGAGEVLTSLPGEETGENDVVYPSLDQLSPQMRQSLAALSSRKVLR